MWLTLHFTWSVYLCVYIYHAPPHGPCTPVCEAQTWGIWHACAAGVQALCEAMHHVYTKCSVYNGLMYFRYSQDAAKFFNVCRRVFSNWEEISSNILVKCNEKNPSTDLLYAVTALIVGEEICTMPSMDFIKFIHI